MRTPAQTPATPPTALKKIDCIESWPAPQTAGTNPPISIPKLPHIAITPRPMRN